MSGTHQFFTMTGRALPLPPSHTPKRSSSVLRLPTRRYDPLIDDVKRDTGGKGRCSYESPYGGEFVYRTERERRNAQLVVYNPRRRRSTPPTAASTQGSRHASRGRKQREGSLEDDTVTGGTDLISNASGSRAGQRPRQQGESKGPSPDPRRINWGEDPSNSDDDVPSLDPHHMGSSRSSLNKSLQRQRPKQQRPQPGKPPSGSSARESAATRSSKTEASKHRPSARRGTLAGDAEVVSLIDRTPTSTDVSAANEDYYYYKSQPQQTQPAPIGTASFFDARRRPAAKPTPSQGQQRNGGEGDVYPPRSERRTTPSEERDPWPKPAPLQTPYVYGDSLRQQQQPTTRRLDPDQPLPKDLYPNGRPRRSPSPATYQPFAASELSRSQGASTSRNAAEGLPPTPRYSRSPRRDSAGGSLNGNLNTTTDTISERVRHLSTSPDRLLPQSGSVSPSGLLSQERLKGVFAVGGTELLPSFPTLQGQEEGADYERERHYRTIVRFIERQPEGHRRELRKLYTEQYVNREEAFVALLSEAYGESFEAMKASTSMLIRCPS